MQDISALLTEIRNQFISELPTRLDNIESCVLALEKDDNFMDVFEEVYRAAHSLKGSAGTHGLYILSDIAHNFENELSRIDPKEKNCTSAQTNILLENIDLLRQALIQIKKNDDNFSDIEKKLSILRSSMNEQSLRVLVVESSQVIIEMTQQALADYTTQLEFCHNGIDALKRLLQGHFDLVITHIEAPMLNGIALVAALRLSKPNENITSILLTSRPVKALHCSIDPDYIIQKDKDFIENLSAIIPKIISRLKESEHS